MCINPLTINILLTKSQITVTLTATVRLMVMVVKPQGEMTEAPKKVDLGLLEEDDEFEEFPAEDWTAKEEDDQDINVWEDNWDDDNVEDEFSNQLRAELEKCGHKVNGSGEAMKT